MDKDQWQFGLTKVFIKTPESLFILEELRDRKYHGYAKTIQTCYRKWKSRKYFLDLKKEATDIFTIRSKEEDSLLTVTLTVITLTS
jgi:myosin-1